MQIVQQRHQEVTKRFINLFREAKTSDALERDAAMNDDPGTFRRLFHIKALHLEWLPLESQLFLVEHYLTSCRQILGTKQADGRDVAEHPLKQEHMSPALREATVALIRLKTDQWQLELAWAESLHEQIIARLKQHVGTIPPSAETSPPSQNRGTDHSFERSTS